MGFFNFSKYNDIEKTILDQYTKWFDTIINISGIPMSGAKKITKNILNQAIEESKKSGSYDLPQNFGNLILGEEKTDDPVIQKLAQTIREKLPKKKAEGVKDEDIRWWWNLNDIERRMMLKQDDINKMYLAECYTQEEKLTREKAIQKVRKFQPFYGDPSDTTHVTGDDRPLPYELKDRINIYIQNRYTNDKEKYRKDMDESSSFNALIRKEIRNGAL